MQLAIDTSTLVAEVLRTRGRELLTHPAVALVVTPKVMDETRYEIPGRIGYLVRRGVLGGAEGTDLAARIERSVVPRLTLVPAERFADRLPEAYRRIPRDPDDAPTVALALALGCAVWTGDRDFFGCGLAVWSTDVLRRYLEQPRDAVRRSTIA